MNKSVLFVKIFHNIFWIAVLLAPFMTKNLDVLMSVVAIIGLTIITWIIKGTCIITDFEHYLGDKPKKWSNGCVKTPLNTFYVEKLGIPAHHAVNLIVYISVFVLGYSLYNIYYLRTS